MSDEIRNALEATNTSHRQLAEALGMVQQTLSGRLRNNYKTWNNEELGEIQWFFARHGYDLNVSKIYDKILTHEIEKFEDLLEYLPMTDYELANIIGVTPATIGNGRRDGFKNIDVITDIKEVIMDYTPFILLEGYY